MLSAQDQENEIKHRRQDNEMGIVSLAYLLGIGGIQIHVSYCIDALHMKVVDIYSISSYTV